MLGQYSDPPLQNCCCLCCRIAADAHYRHSIHVSCCITMPHVLTPSLTCAQLDRHPYWSEVLGTHAVLWVCYVLVWFALEFTRHVFKQSNRKKQINTLHTLLQTREMFFLQIVTQLCVLNFGAVEEATPCLSRNINSAGFYKDQLEVWVIIKEERSRVSCWPAE